MKKVKSLTLTPFAIIFMILALHVNVYALQTCQSVFTSGIVTTNSLINYSVGVGNGNINTTINSNTTISTSTKYNNLTVNNNKTLTLQGNITIRAKDTFELNNNSNLTINGNVIIYAKKFKIGRNAKITVNAGSSLTVYVKDEAKFKSGSSIVTLGSPSDFALYSQKDVKFDGNNGTYSGYFYAYNKVESKNSVNINGSVVSNQFENNNLNVTYTQPSSSLNIPGVCGGSSLSSSLVLDYHMDECSWNGTIDEIKDSSNSSFNATAINGANTDSNNSIFYNYGKFDGVNDYVKTTNIYNTLKGTATLSFWIKTIQSGNNTDWKAPGITGVEKAGSADDISWGWIDASGHIGISAKQDTHNAISNNSINDNVWHFIALTRDKDTGKVQVFVDGIFNSSATQGTGIIGTSFSSIGRIEDTGGTPEYFKGNLDELKIFNTVLSSSQIKQIYDNEKIKKNYDGTTRAQPICSSLTQCYTDNFNRTNLGNKWNIIKNKNYTPQVNSNSLWLTKNSGNIATGVTLVGSFPSTNNYVEIEFTQNAYGKQILQYYNL